MERRIRSRSYEPLLPQLFPVRLYGAGIRVDFAVGADPGGSPGRQTPRTALDARVSPRQVLAWLRSMPSYRVGVPLELGDGGDVGRASHKRVELTELLDPGRSVVLLVGRPLTAAEHGLLSRPRHGLQVRASVPPRSAETGVARDPLELVRSAERLDPRLIHWVVGPLAADGLEDATAVLEALPAGSRVSLVPAAPPAHPLPIAVLGDLEVRALARGLALTDFSCRQGPAQVGRGFAGVDRITAQADLGRRALDLVTCAGCPSRMLCHGALDQGDLLGRLSHELGVIGLAASSPPSWTGPRSLRLEVDQPTAAGDEAYLSHALGPPVTVSLSTGVAPPDPEDEALDPAVLRRWWATGFMPVSELNGAAERSLDDLGRRHWSRSALVPDLAAASA